MSKMRWDRIPKPVVHISPVATFCRRCGARFVPRRRYHSLCTACAAKKFGGA